MDYWNIDIRRDISLFIFIFNPFGGGALLPTLNYPRTHLYFFERCNQQYLVGTAHPANKEFLQP
jgi:hypothetical protein